MDLNGVNGPLLVWDSNQGSADFVLTPTGMQQGGGLSGPVLQSLFTDARDPDATDDPRGWWGDAFPVVDGDVWGSLLWLEDRTKNLPTTPDLLRQRIETGLQWFIADGVTQRIDVTVTPAGPEKLAVLIEIFKPLGSSTNQRFQFVWDLP